LLVETDLSNPVTPPRSGFLDCVEFTVSEVREDGFTENDSEIARGWEGVAKTRLDIQ
jgi:hypothetical protein